MKVLHVVGARPNFMKAAPLIEAMARFPERFEQRLIHTGQHYDESMSQVFFRQLGLPKPDGHLNVGSGSHAQQVARVMLAFESVVLDERPDLVIVVGDVNSTLAATLVCAKLGVSVAHVEAGLRSNDWTMPEEVNRVLVDRMADLLFTPCVQARENLLREGVQSERIHFVGNVMIDTLVKLLPKAVERPILGELDLEPNRYVLATLHRPCNVDHPATLREILSALQTIAGQCPVVFPLHPRTKERIRQHGISVDPSLRLIEPVGYLEFLALMRSARVVVTDSGGVQEETTFLGVPCLTVRHNTERPVTVTCGTNCLVSPEQEAIVRAFKAALAERDRVAVPELWDGNASKRIVDTLLSMNR